MLELLGQFLENVSSEQEVAVMGEIILGAILIPWVVWVTTSIFSMRQAQAVMRAEMKLMDEIKSLLHDLRGKFST